MKTIIVMFFISLGLMGQENQQINILDSIAVQGHVISNNTVLSYHEPSIEEQEFKIVGPLLFLVALYMDNNPDDLDPTMIEIYDWSMQRYQFIFDKDTLIMKNNQ